MRLSPRDEAERIRIAAGLIVALIWFVAVLRRGGGVLQDPDIWWHIAAGRWISEHGFPTTDPFSHSFAGQPWIAKEWLSQVAYFAAHALGGWSGVMLLAAAAVGLAAAMLHAAVSHYLAPLPAALIALVCMFLASSTFLARPHLLTIAILMLWTWQLFEASLKQRAPHFGLLLLLLLWANFHAMFVMGVVIALFAFLDFMERSRLTRRGELVKWMGFLGLCPLAALAHPYFTQSLLIALDFAGHNEAVALIDEWQPFSAPASVFHGIALLALVFLPAVTGFRLGIARSLLIVLLLHLFLSHMRFAYFLFPVLAIVVAPEIARQFPKISAAGWRAQARDPLERAASRHFRPLAAATAGIMLLVAGLQAFVLRTQPPESVSASAAIRHAKEYGLSGPVWNAYGFGGPLIFNGIPTFIDGRNDQLFLGGFSTAYMRGPDTPAAFAAALKQHGIAWTMLPPGDPRARMLDTMPGWTRVFADVSAVIHVRAEDGGSAAARSYSQARSGD